jgi:uncharacterized UPF0146 family protein
MNIDDTCERYVGRHVPHGVSAGTVADFVDSYDHLRPLATAANDLKDLQRPWAFKTILATIPKGSRICEIGAGEPLVAGALSDLGYDVTVVDPYDGSGNGPTALERFREDYPRVRFINQPFSSQLKGISAAEFDAIYSISVLEHLREAALKEVVAGCQMFLTLQGRQFHAIDYVAAGHGSEFHRSMLGFFLDHFGIGSGIVDAVITQAMTDTETYFLSAEAHNRWRGQTPYEQFPMRKVFSIQCVL